MIKRAWLYVRQDESIWLEQPSEDSRLLRMMGPSVHRQVLTFAHGDELTAFVAQTHERLVANGWVFQDLGAGGERRQRASGPPSGVERRVP